jgi:gamma-glutamylcyclotransferase (GGCT)/AIG2-like uncharacterized protein YtfP
MSLEGKKRENLFSYGTLQIEEVQLSTFGRRLEGKSDILAGYRLTLIPIPDQTVVARSGETHYRNIQFTGSATDLIEGTVFTVTEDELEQADVYEEDADYQRVMVQMKSGLNAWVYLNIDQEHQSL